MKKKTTAFVVALMGAASAFAQPAAGTISITPKVGFNVSTAGKAFDTKYTIGSDAMDATAGAKAGFAAGIEVGHQMTDKFALSVGVIYSQQGAQRDYTTSYGDYYSLKDKSKGELSYLNVPILANFYLFKGFAVKAGIQPGFLFSAKTKMDRTASGTAAKLESHDETDVKEYCNKVDFSIPVGISYEFSNIVIDARYNIGVTNIKNDSKIEKGANNGKNGVFQLTVGYKINL